MNSLWLIIVSLAAFAVAYRFYGAFLAAKVAVLDDRRETPAHRLKDGVDYHPTNRLVLFGHHFAAIAGPGPLVGPVLAAQWGFLPGFSWIIVGACLAGGVHDFVILLASVRQNGLTLPQIARANLGPVSGAVTSLATLFIIVITLAAVGKIVVSVLSGSALGMFTIVVTIPAALLTGLWMYKIRPGKVGEASVIGVTIVLLGVFFGSSVAASPAAGGMFKLSAEQLSVMLPVYALIASILPVWVLMCPRDYLSSYMKIGVMLVLAVGIVVAHPVLKMPATTPFLGGGGPVVGGPVWPFVCIVIMCGAISGFHSLIASGTTPKMINRERDIRPIGYGAMVLEGFIAVTALVAACALEPGDYFLINVDAKAPAMRQAYDKMMARPAESLGFDPRPKELGELEKETNETLAHRPGGAVTLAVGMAKVFSNVPGMKTLLAYWYHFVIMFEALFILTLLETGTRVTRFVFQETLGQFGGARGSPAGAAGPACPKCGQGLAGSKVEICPACGVEVDPNDLMHAVARGHKANWAANVSMSCVTCFLWGYLLYTGNIDTLWRMLGIANQLLATIALVVGTTYLLNHAPRRIYALLTAIPLAFVIVTVFAAGVMSIQAWQARLAEATESGEIFRSNLMCVLAAIMLVLTGIIAADAVYRWWVILCGRGGWSW